MADCVAKGRMKHGESNGRARLWDAAAVDIRASYAAREATLQELADRYGVTTPTISDVVHWRTWRHVALLDQPN